MDQKMLNVLKSTRLFEAISEQDIPHMLGCIGAVERTFDKSEFIFLEGDQLNQIGLLLDGEVSMIKEDVWGDRMLLTVFGVGEVFGESFVCNDHAQATVSFQASEDCRILLIPFHRLLRTCGVACRFHHQLIENMVFLMAQKNVQLMEKMEVLSKKTMREKLLVWLSQQAQLQNSKKFTTAMGRIELAEYLCVDRSALTRELSNMRADGLINYEKNTFELLS